MAQPVHRLLVTAEELFQLPNDGYKYELVEGKLISMAPTGGKHGKVTARLTWLLAEYVEAHDLGVICGAETGFILQRTPDRVRAPDVSFVAKARIPATGEPETYWPFAPDLAVEVVSPSDRFADIEAKGGEYFQAGTQLVWVIDPGSRSIFVYRSAQGVRTLGEAEELSGENVLPGFACWVSRCFD